MRRGTYSIVARDPSTGDLGVAVQSHWFSVGPIVPWARAGVGAVATQSIAEPAYGPRMLDRLERGQTPDAALAELLEADDAGRIPSGGGRSTSAGAPRSTAARAASPSQVDAGGDGFCAQANMMASADVWPAMAHAFEAATGPLARRLMAALHAAEGRGGDVRGRQSAALLVVPAEGEGWETVRDLRVEDHDDPLAELDRLLGLADAYELAARATTSPAPGDTTEAGARYERASALAPGNAELLFWSGLAAAQAGDMERALERVRARDRRCGPRGVSCSTGSSRTSRPRPGPSATGSTSADSFPRRVCSGCRNVLADAGAGARPRRVCSGCRNVLADAGAGARPRRVCSGCRKVLADVGVREAWRVRARSRRRLSGQRSPGVLRGYALTGMPVSSAVLRMRCCSAL